jgi:hypothetical protein
MASEHDKQGEANRPAYDNPVRNKGELAVGNNVRERPQRPSRPDRPEGHASDKKLGQSPPVEKPLRRS